MQEFPSERSLEHQVGAVVCEQDERLPASRYFAYDMMQELYDERRKKEPEAPGGPVTQTFPPLPTALQRLTQPRAACRPSQT